MNTLTTPIILSKEDYDLIIFYLRKSNWRNPADNQSADKLEAELIRAKIVSKSNLHENICSVPNWNSADRLSSRGICKVESTCRGEALLIEDVIND